VSTEVAIELSTNSHQRPPPETPPRTVPGLSLFPLPEKRGSRSVNYDTAAKKDLKRKRAGALDKARPRPAKLDEAGDLRRGGCEVLARRTRSGGRPASPRP
jgi:hypothetical protein